MDYQDELKDSLYQKRYAPEKFLTAEEEQELLKKILAGDRKALDKLFHSGFGIIFNTAKKYHGKSLPFEDLIEEGNNGFMLAISHFDASKGVRFSSYLGWWTRNCISRAVREQARMIRIPDHQLRRIKRIERIFYESGAGYTLEVIDKVSREEKILCKEVYRLLEMARETVSLSDRVKNNSEEGDTDTIENFVADKQENPVRDVEVRSLRNDLRHALSFLPEIEARVITDKFGLNGDEGMHTQQELALKYNCSRALISKIERRALKRLRENPEVCRVLEGYL